MGRNVEVKVMLKDVEGIRCRLADLGVDPQGVLKQMDTYLESQPGTRLKVREQTSGGHQLIVYRRPDEEDLRTSEYVLAPIPATLKEAMASAPGVRGVIRKTRDLWMWGRTRIHLDEVDGLGSFLELEVVMAEDEEIRVGQYEAEKILKALGLDAEPRISGSYMDLADARHR